MADNQRIEDLRRRVQKDPASIAFAQLAEELRRAHQLPEAVEVCRAGLALHPSYLSARVTLGRTLVELNELEHAEEELNIVLRSAPENLAAMRGLGEIYLRAARSAGARAVPGRAGDCPQRSRSCGNGRRPGAQTRTQEAIRVI
jgi:predicted Zn-dependent protease